MRLAVFYYLAQAQKTDRRRQAHCDKPPRSEKSGAGPQGEYSRTVRPGPGVCPDGSGGQSWSSCSMPRGR
jgi:hypothetical protein